MDELSLLPVPVVPAKRNRTVTAHAQEIEETWDCGLEVTLEARADPALTIKCTREGCESGWYHRLCINYEGRHKGWVCQSCGGGKRRRLV
ncbi:hypothetical protein B0H17DRAFT_1049161 [Mycena rosella]|uniref:Zinc finger PHD-type domain-containing protein n=1 Tax=Mycena rosella TaxID=1033263 RepID=A0AAD7DTX9_MYCRO|nr:hypothetical protein B0H17DRAFT_1049161 [Mycena rosella]